MASTSFSRLYQIQVLMTSRGEDVALEQEFVIFFQVVQRILQRAGRLGHLGQFFGLQIVDVFVERIARFDLVLDAVEHGHQHRGEYQVGIARAVRAAEFNALGLRAWRINGNADGSRAIAAAIGKIDGRFITRHQRL